MWGATATEAPVAHLHDISIHAPRVGRDEALLGCCRETAAFQSTHPVRGATASPHADPAHL